MKTNNMFRFKLWLARRSKGIDRKFTEKFWKEYREMILNATNATAIDTRDIKFKKNRELKDSDYKLNR
jgi:hypothetical protein